MRLTSLVVAFGLALAAGESALAAPPGPGWRAATHADMDRLAGDTPASSRPPGQKLRITADFDGDGRKDTAAIYLNEAKGAFGVFVMRGAGGPAIELHRGKLGYVWNTDLDVVPPDRYETACGRGHGDDTAPCRPVIVTRWPAIAFFYYEASSQIFFWNGRRFDGEWITD